VAGVASTVGAVVAMAVGSVHGAAEEVVQARASTGAAAKQVVKCATTNAEKGSYTAKDGSRRCYPCSNRTFVFCQDT
jgi:hypothetical protein